MPLVIPPDFGQATLQWSVIGRANPVSCTIGYAIDLAGITPAQAAQAIYDSLATPNGFCDADRMWDVFTFEGVSVHQNVGGTIFGGNSTGTVVGTNSTATVQPMILSSTLVVSKRTPQVGRHFRGRMYMPLMAFGENTVDYNGNILSAVTGVATTAAGLMLTGMTAQDCPPVLLHESVAVGPTIPPTAITGFSVSSKVGTQRRRIR